MPQIIASIITDHELSSLSLVSSRIPGDMTTKNLHCNGSIQLVGCTISDSISECISDSEGLHGVKPPR